LKPLNGVGDGHLFAGRPGEDLGHRERLAEEPLDLAGAEDDEFVLGRKFVHAENGDDVLQILVALEDALDAAGDLVVFLPTMSGAERAREVEASGSTAG
jgi:hypothetical protein